MVMKIEIAGVTSTTNKPGHSALPETASTEKAQHLQSLEKRLQGLLRDTRLRMQVSEEAGQVVVQVIDANSGQMLRQIPSEAALRLAEEMAHYQSTQIRA
jgi:flagellar protein FlaG